jgi:glutathione peroxidase
MQLYDVTVKDADQHDIPLADYRGKVLLIVNTATGCGFTPQYEGLERLYLKYRDEGFEILDFPCNQFHNQAPGTDQEIVQFCQLTYGVSFKTFSKIDVNGPDASPLFVQLKEASAELRRAGSGGVLGKLKGVLGDEIKWNFTKFLIDREGRLVERFAPNVAPEKIAPQIESLL